MLGVRKIDPALDTSKVLNGIQGAVHRYLKHYGFREHGRTIHRFVSGDISRVIAFQLGQAHRGETHLLFVNTGIRVPECMYRSFDPEENPKKYYHEYDCNIRSLLGVIEGKEDSCYDLRDSAEVIIADILRQIQAFVIPVFETLNSRDAILAHRREYPAFDIMSRHQIVLEEAMIYGRRSERAKASEALNLYYRLCRQGEVTHKDPRVIQRHLEYLDELAERLGILIENT